jgi:protein involved in polysaccharide export with SLBB domain
MFINKPAHILFVFFVSFAALAQDISDDFLQSLPEALKGQISESNTNSDEVQKLFELDTSQDNNKRILQDIKRQLDDLESLISPERNSDKTDLEVFGSEFFSSVQSTFMPINLPNFSNDYILNIGDSLNITFASGNSRTNEVFVERDGSILLSEYGKINIAGLSFQDANELINNYVQNKDIGQEVFVSLSKLRDIQVILLGWVKNPGIYTLSAGSNLIGALDVAGGISENGSYRSINLKRNGKEMSIDLYDIFVFGNFNPNNHLRSGDVIFVNPKNKHISISGGVNKPAIYEILPEENLSNLLTFSGGLSGSFKDFDHLLVDRKSLNSNTIIRLDRNDFNIFQLQERDSILVPFYESHPQKQKTISIEGMVNRPGEYFINEDTTLLDVLKIAGGYKEGAYEFGGAVFREQAREIENVFSQKEYNATVNYLISNLGNPNSVIPPQTLDILREELNSKIFSGRVSTSFNMTELEASPNLNIKLEDGDRIVVPQMSNVVHLVGEFNNPSNHIYDPSKSVTDYIREAGKLKSTAEGLVLVIDPDGRSTIVEKKWFLVSTNNVPLYPGSIIYAPRDIANLSGIRYASVVAPIVSSLAISLASLNSINN